MFSRRLSLVSSYALASVLCMAAGAGTAPAADAPKLATNFRLKPAEKDLLLKIAAGTKEAPVTVDMNSAEFKVLWDKELLQVNRQQADAAGNAPAILSALGQAKADTYGKAPGTGTPRGPLPKPDDFEIEDGIEVPESRRGAQAREVYPFERLAVGQSFFLAPSEHSDNPAKAKQSTVSAMNKRAAEAFEAKKAAGDPEANAEGAVAPKWTIRPAEKNGVKGARIWRVQ